MPLSHSIRFDEARSCYRVRFRGKVYDRTQMVPRRIFERAGVPSNEASDRGRRIAERWAIERAHELEAEHLGRDEKKMTLQQLFALRREKNPNEVGESTVGRHMEMEANLVRILGHRWPDEIDDADALAYRNERGKEKDRRDGELIRNRTIKNELRHLKTTLEDGYQWRRETGMRELNLFRLPLIRKQAGFEVQLTNEELRLLFTAEMDHDTARYRDIFQLGLVSMMRVDNLMGARREWWDLEKRWRRVPAGHMKGASGEKRELSVPISEWEAEIVERAMRRAGRSRLLFPNFNGHPSKWPRKTVKAIAAATGIRYFTAHDLRRTGSGILEEHGRSKLEIKLLMGHAEGGDVTDDYVQRAARERIEDRLREAVKVFDQVRRELTIPSSKER